MKGTVKWFRADQGFGYIMPDDGGRDIYVQAVNIDMPDPILSDGQRVEFEYVVGRKGPEAVHVRPVSNDS
jgi:CspA family cold shock protein